MIRVWFKKPVVLVSGGLAFLCAFGVTNITHAQLASDSVGTDGKKCKVESGDNKGKTGTFTENGTWCEGSWGGTACTDTKGKSNGKCKNAESAGTRPGDFAIIDGNNYLIATKPGDGPSSLPPYGPDELARLLRSGALNALLPITESKIVGAVRLGKSDPNAIEITDRNCSGWKPVPLGSVEAASPTSLPPIECGGTTYPVMSISLTDSGPSYGDSDRGGGPPVVTFFSISSSFRIPRFSFANAISDWDSCVNRYIDCQIDCGDSGGGVFGSSQSCLDHCEAVFDACTFEPF